MRAKDDTIIKMASQSGMPVKRVTKPSKNPAMMKKGIVLITILSPAFTPFIKDCSLV